MSAGDAAEGNISFSRLTNGIYFDIIKCSAKRHYVASVSNKIRGGSAYGKKDKDSRIVGWNG